MKQKIKSLFAYGLSFAVFTAMVPVNAFAADETASIQIVHTNDIHGYYTKTDNGTLGFAVLKSIVEKEGADLVLDAGDTFHGQAFATIEEGKSIAQLMDYVGYDAMTLGNHDWSYGSDRLKELDAESNFKIIASNVVTESGESFFENNYVIKDVVADDGTNLKVGIVGVIDDSFYTSTAAENVSGLKFEEEAAAASEMAQYLRNNEKCDIVLAITHQSNCEGFVSNIIGIDAVLAGHEHVVMNENYIDSQGKIVPVVEAGYYFGNVGVMEITVDPASKDIVSVEESTYDINNIGDITENAEVKSAISAIEEREQVILSEVVGQIDIDYPYSWEDIRISQQEIGKFVAESYLAKTSADVAFENAGGIRAGLSKGDVTYKDIISISPYGNGLVTKKITGKEIIDILNQSLALGKACDDVYSIQKEAAANGEDPYQYSWPEGNGSYLQFSGIEIETDENNQIVSAFINGNAVDENKVYTVATNNYVADGGDYSALVAAPLKKEYDTCEQALLSYIKNTESEENITRGKAVEMLIEAADDYNPSIEKSDIIKGYDDGLLHEDKPVTKLEALIMLSRAFGDIPQGEYESATEKFTNIPDWAKTELEEVFKSGIIDADDKGMFNTYEYVTAEEMESFINNVIAVF